MISSVFTAADGRQISVSNEVYSSPFGMQGKNYLAYLHFRCSLGWQCRKTSVVESNFDITKGAIRMVVEVVLGEFEFNGQFVDRVALAPSEEQDFLVESFFDSPIFKEGSRNLVLRAEVQLSLYGASFVGGDNAFARVLLGQGGLLSQHSFGASIGLNNNNGNNIVPTRKRVVDSDVVVSAQGIEVFFELNEEFGEMFLLMDGQEVVRFYDQTQFMYYVVFNKGTNNGELAMEEMCKIDGVARYGDVLDTALGTSLKLASGVLEQKQHDFFCLPYDCEYACSSSGRYLAVWNNQDVRVFLFDAPQSVQVFNTLKLQGASKISMCNNGLLCCVIDNRVCLFEPSGGIYRQISLPYDTEGACGAVSDLHGTLYFCMAKKDAFVYNIYQISTNAGYLVHGTHIGNISGKVKDVLSCANGQFCVLEDKISYVRYQVTSSFDGSSIGYSRQGTTRTYGFFICQQDMGLAVHFDGSVATSVATSNATFCANTVLRRQGSSVFVDVYPHKSGRLCSFEVQNVPENAQLVAVANALIVILPNCTSRVVWLNDRLLVYLHPQLAQGMYEVRGSTYNYHAYSQPINLKMYVREEIV